MRKFIRKIILLIFVFVLLTVSFVVFFKYQDYKQLMEISPLEKEVEVIQSDPHYIKFEDISKDYLNGVVAIEDERFYKHGGVDYLALFRTLMTNIVAKDILGGGSTITQQLAKNIYFMEDYSFDRKIEEVFVAYALEKNYSKEEILELYANIVYFGDNYYGIYEASKGYYNTSPSSLTLSQASMLAGLPQAPSIYALSNNNSASYIRQEKVLEAMLEHNYISKEQFIEALK